MRHTFHMTQHTKYLWGWNCGGVRNGIKGGPFLKLCHHRGVLHRWKYDDPLGPWLSNSLLLFLKTTSKGISLAGHMIRARWLTWNRAALWHDGVGDPRTGHPQNWTWFLRNHFKCLGMVTQQVKKHLLKTHSLLPAQWDRNSTLSWCRQGHSSLSHAPPWAASSRGTDWSPASSSCPPTPPVCWWDKFLSTWFSV